MAIPRSTRWPIDRWHGNSVFGPAVWDLIIDLGGSNHDPKQIIHLGITGNTEDALAVSGLEDWIPRGQINAIGDVDGKRYWIICDTSDTGQWWSDAYPNGLVRGLRIRSLVESSTTNTLTDTTQGWAINHWTGFDLICNGDDGKLHRVTISSNTKDTLSLPTQTWSPAPATEYHIIAHGALWHESSDCPIGAWYRSLMESARRACRTVRLAARPCRSSVSMSRSTTGSSAPSTPIRHRALTATSGVRTRTIHPGAAGQELYAGDFQSRARPTGLG